MPVVVLMWLLLVSVFRGGGEINILFKYVRIALVIYTVSLIFGSVSVSPKVVVKAISLAFGIHLALVGLQVIYPGLTYITAPLFGFDREISILSGYQLRKLGASSSYDTASFLSISSLIFFYLLLVESFSFPVLMMVIASFAASLMSSRMGIGISLILVGIIFISQLLSGGFVAKILATLGAIGVSIVAYTYLYPLLQQSLGLEAVSTQTGNPIFSSGDYGTTGTYEALKGDYLLPLSQSIFDLFVGFGVDPNKIGAFTDIGYVKLIYHVGILGTVAILWIHFYMFIKTVRWSKMRTGNSELRLLSAFLSYLIFLGLIFNYKALIIYSRGIGDFLFILFIFLLTSRKRVPGSKPGYVLVEGN